MVDRGDNTYGGKFVVNPSGGLISKGHPLGATGLEGRGASWGNEGSYGGPIGQGGKPLREWGPVREWVLCLCEFLSVCVPVLYVGLAQCSELCWQLRGEAGARQVPNARLALQHNIGLGGAVVVTLYRRGFPSQRSWSRRVGAAHVSGGLKSAPVFDEIERRVTAVCAVHRHDTHVCARMCGSVHGR